MTEQHASPAALAALAAPVDLSVAPPRDAVGLRVAIAARYRVPVEAVLVGPGVASLLHGLVARCASAGGEIVHSAPSFALYPQLAAAYGLRGRAVALRDYRHDLPAMAWQLSDRTRMVLLDSPHNVTGTTVSLPEVVSLARTLPSGALVVFDNVYGEYQDTLVDRAFASIVASGAPIVVCRSFSKAHRLFGLRVGYLIAHPEVLARSGPTVLRYDVGALAQAAATASIQDGATVDANRQVVAAARHRVEQALTTAGLTWVPSQSSTVLVHVEPGCDALAMALRDRGCQVRTVADHGLPHHLQLIIDGGSTACQVDDALSAKGAAWTSP
ncbi:MAG: aminotransferase class I/II-fold pyridoxal phosphate-dependent enzyme [Micromonosporaceae bacterium]|nr:aminotransferase class I/II-fold pyridoxal phosphate-dependent enzyme [Micromonosporaceae bacterium]